MNAAVEGSTHEAKPGVELRQESGYRFANRFGSDLPVLYSDEPAPLGTGTGPSPLQLLAAAVGNCLAASLLFALKKFKQSPEPIGADAVAIEGRDDQNRLRVRSIQVRLTLGVPAARLEHLDRVLERFEDYCTVTQSVRRGIPVIVEIADSEGVRLKQAADRP